MLTPFGYEGYLQRPIVPRYLREKFGTANVYKREARSILTPASGFIRGYDFTLNPYRGCQYGCSYCYAMAFSPNQAMRQNWGDWVILKQNAEACLRQDLTRWYKLHANRPPCIYMSTVTDPYQPIETRSQITRSLLFTMLEFTPTPTLVIQTRSPMVIRDVDLFQRFERLRLNMSIPTGCEQVRRDFESRSPSIQSRLAAVRKIRSTIDPSKGFLPKFSITITPTLPTPIEQQSQFIERLRIADRIEIQPFHATRHQPLIASTPQAAIALKQKYRWWYDTEVEHYQQFKEALIRDLLDVQEGKEGFSYD